MKANQHSTARQAWLPVLVGLAAAGLFADRRASGQDKEAPTLGTIERLDPRLDQIVPKDARVERIAEGFDWSEGPVWDRRGGYLLFSDVPMNTVFKWKEARGPASSSSPAATRARRPEGASRARTGC